MWLSHWGIWGDMKYMELSAGWLCYHTCTLSEWGLAQMMSLVLQSSPLLQWGWLQMPTQTGFVVWTAHCNANFPLCHPAEKPSIGKLMCRLLKDLMVMMQAGMLKNSKANLTTLCGTELSTHTTWRSLFSLFDPCICFRIMDACSIHARKPGSPAFWQVVSM